MVLLLHRNFCILNLSIGKYKWSVAALKKFNFKVKMSEDSRSSTSWCFASSKITSPLGFRKNAKTIQGQTFGIKGMFKQQP